MNRIFRKGQFYITNSKQLHQMATLKYKNSIYFKITKQYVKETALSLPAPPVPLPGLTLGSRQEGLF